MSDDSAIKVSLAPLISEARRQGLWLFCTYQQLWFSPDDLRKANDEGKFLWGPVNWSLRHPRERLRELEQAASLAEEERARFAQRMHRP